MLSNLVFTTIAFTLRRHLAKNFPKYGRLTNAFFFLCVLYPLALILASYNSPQLHIGWLNAMLLFFGSAVFPLVLIFGYWANKYIDAGFSTILQNLTPIVIIIFASLLLHETLAGRQVYGAIMIILSAIVITLPSIQQKKIQKRKGVLLALVSVTLLGLGTVYERWMLTRVNFGAYLVLGQGSQVFWMVLLATPELKYMSRLKQKGVIIPVAFYSVALALGGLSMVAVLKLSNNASIAGSLSSFRSITVVIAAYVFLRERKHVRLKLAAATIGILGVILIL